MGIDFAGDRIQFAEKHYAETRHRFRCMDLRQPLDELGAFDFIWIRFVLEYYLEGSVDIIRNAASALKPDGRLCLLDLDYNCLTHYPMKVEMESILQKLVFKMMQKFSFATLRGQEDVYLPV